MNTIPSPLSVTDIEKVIMQVLESAPDKELPEEDVHAAMDAMHDIAMNAVFWELWKEGRSEVGWDPVAKELLWRASGDTRKPKASKRGSTRAQNTAAS